MPYQFNKIDQQREENKLPWSLIYILEIKDFNQRAWRGYRGK